MRVDNLPEYPSRRELSDLELTQAFNLAAQAILGTYPDYPMERIRGALGHARNPEALSRAMRKSFPRGMFSLGHNNH